jgi:hypothetical protein
MAAPGQRAAGEPASGWDAALEAMPGVLRLGVRTVGHTAGWTMSAYVRTWTRLARAVVDEREAAALGEDMTALSVQVACMARGVAHGTPVADVLEHWGLAALDDASSVLRRRAAALEREVRALRDVGEALLRRSRDVWDEDSRHPAYAAILRDLAPDEARILVLLLRDGPQPTVDVLVGGMAGRLRTSRLIARELTMIGPHAGVRHSNAVPAHLNNLARLGLVRSSPEPVSELRRYQVLEVQPDVLVAVHSVRFPKLVRGSIHLTPLGVDFCRACLVDEDE